MNTKVQMSVTDIKKLQTEDHEELPDLPEVPEFIAKKEGLTGAERGTLYHKVMTHLPIKTALTLEEIESFLVILVGKNIITESDRKYLEPGVFLKFLRSPIAKRMETAKSLQREKPFVLGIPVGEMLQIEHNGDDIVMIQGVIDAFFEEDNELVLVDYKTDRVFPGQEGLLEKRYGEQLMYYRRALEQITGKKVRESLIIPLMMPDSK